MSLSTKATWHVGDAVLVHQDEGTTTLGHIVEIKRGGWYTIRTTLEDGHDGTTVKCRAKNLARCPHNDNAASMSLSPVAAATVPSNQHEIPAGMGSIDKTALATTTVPSVGPLHHTLPNAATTVPTTAMANVAAAVAPVFPHVTSSQDAPELPIVAPPPPTLIDLDELLLRLPPPAALSLSAEYVQQLEYFATFRQWVVFTDLHCSSATLDTCRQVLEMVHAQAVQRKAGILFLGDFWHVRGSIRVDLLNAILLDSLAHWTQPCIMIPGNHDQVTAALTDNHSLTPLQHAYRVKVPPAAPKDTIGIARPDTLPGIVIFSQPTIFCQALWIPHVRSPAVLESILQSPLAQDNAVTKAIFCHVDLVGGYMNDNIVSNGGVSPRVFPPNIPVYTGHFHKPHVVARTTYDEVSGDKHVWRIEYLGSPYQVSLAEAQQAKALVVLEYAPSVNGDNATWSCVDRIPISVGRKHFRPSTMADFLALKIAVSETDSFQVKPGDRVVFSVEKQELADLRSTNATKLDTVTSATGGPIMNQLDEHVALLRKAGVLVEIREKVLDWSDCPTASTSGAQATTGSATVPIEDLSPPSLWDAFLNYQVERGTMSESARATVQSAGIELIEEIESGTNTNDTAVDGGDDHGEATSSVVSAPFTKAKPATANGFQLHSLSLQGFGPFRDPITYPLLDRGLVLIRGANRDGGSDRYVRNVHSCCCLANRVQLTHFSMLQQWNGKNFAGHGNLMGLDWLHRSPSVSGRQGFSCRE
jgi:Calcineurin-like phosphoesterase